MRCIFGDFGVRDGVMQSRALAFDSTDTIIIGEGSISLKDEQLDLLLRPRPKDRSILSLRSPLRIGGTSRTRRSARISRRWACVAPSRLHWAASPRPLPCWRPSNPGPARTAIAAASTRSNASPQLAM